MQRESSAGYLTRAPRSSGLADVLEILLDRGLVIDAYVRVSLVGIELLTIDLRVVIASVDTYLRFAEAVNRLDLRASDDSKSVPDLFQQGGEELAETKTKGAVEGGMDAIREKIGLGGRGGDDDDDDDDDEGGGRSRSRSRGRSNDR
ncbi:MAG TPA: gas vesicle protein GvpJ [Gaiellaceae bacterium]|nr:gas vesicle protein GvpJ [Gaiellaceae bacterium]